MNDATCLQYLKLMPYLKFKTLLLNSGSMSAVEILHAQTIIKITDVINE